MTDTITPKWRAVPHPHVAGGWTIKRGHEVAQRLFVTKHAAEVEAAAANRNGGKK